MKKYLILLFCLVGCSPKSTQITQPIPARFDCSEKINFSNEIDYHTSSICTDKETGIKYLYIWGGMGNGGPAITRLWEKTK